jgi:phenylacetate-CoA ligase
MPVFSTTSAFVRLLLDGRRPMRELAPIIRERLRGVLTAAQAVPYYREHMERIGYDPRRDFSGSDDLALLPVTTKSDLKGAPESFIQEGSSASTAYFSDYTSGSTGTPLCMHRSAPERAIQVSKWMRVLVASGYRPTDKVYSFTAPARLTHGKSRLQRIGLFRRLTVDYHLTPDKYADLLLAYRPNVIYGVRTCLLMLADELEGRRVALPRIKMVIAGGEVIDDRTRRRCREVFGVDITETYGSIEMGVMAHQRPGETGLTPIEDCTFFEFLDEHGLPARAGQLARLVVTDLHGRFMPMIRYDQGDLATYRWGQNVHGETVRMIDRIIGRQDDVAVLSDGRVLMYLDFYDLLAPFVAVERFRVTQRNRDEFLVELVATAEDYSHMRSQVLSTLKTLSPLPLRFEMRRLEAMESDPGGKRRVLVSNLAGDKPQYDASKLPSDVSGQLRRFN